MGLAALLQAPYTWLLQGLSFLPFPNPWQHLPTEPHSRYFKEGTFGSDGSATIDTSFQFTW